MSDQDFFFDEEDEKPAKPAQKAASKPAAKAPVKKSGAKAAPAQPVSFFDRQITISIAALLVACGILVGVIAGVLIGQARAADTAALSNTSVTGQSLGTNGQAAPALTQDQMTSGQLPAGHPSIGGSGGAKAPSGSKTTTSGK